MKKNSLHEIGSATQCVGAAALRAPQHQAAQHEFLDRGRASLDNAKKTGEFYELSIVLDEMQTRLDKRMAGRD